MDVATFSARIVKDDKSGWTCVIWDDSVAVLGTGKAVRISCVLDEVEMEVTLLSVGGRHMLPLKAEYRKKLQKDVGDEVSVRITARN